MKESFTTIARTKFGGSKLIFSDVPQMSAFLKPLNGYIRVSFEYINDDATEKQKYHISKVLVPRLIYLQAKEQDQIFTSEQALDILIIQVCKGRSTDLNSYDKKELSSMIDKIKRFFAENFHDIQKKY